jgi:hypothetical protein
MISDKQFQANRRNAKNSTGPKTETGKSIASKNSITHGLRSVQPVIEVRIRKSRTIFATT